MIIGILAGCTVMIGDILLGWGVHDAGAIYEKTGKAIAVKLSHPHFHIRARMIQLVYHVRKKAK